MSAGTARLRAAAAWRAGLGAACVAGVMACAPPTPDPVLTEQVSGTAVQLQAVSAVNDTVVWASGHGGTFVRTVNGGATWHADIVGGADTLQFRDVHAVDAQTAYLLAAGAGALSRIYKTVDGGRTWRLQWMNDEPAAFYDCLDFWDPRHGIAFSDAVETELRLIETTDGGDTWRRVDAERLPAALEGEVGYAGGGTCVITRGPRHAWIGTGGAAHPRVIRTDTRGRSWSAVTVPLTGGTQTSGIISLAFRDTLHGVALGGEIADPAGFTFNVAFTTDGGVTWARGSRPTFSGAVYGAAYVRDAPRPTLVAVGPRGAAYSLDDGIIWRTMSREDYWAVDFAGPRAGWMVGPRGRITKISMY